VQLIEVARNHIGVLVRELLQDATGGDRVVAGIVGVSNHDPVVGGHGFEGALALSIAIKLLVDDERVDDGRKILGPVHPVSRGLGSEQRQIVGSVVCDDREPAFDHLEQAVADLLHADGGGDSARSGNLGCDSVHSHCGLGNLDARVEQPVVTLEHFALGSEKRDGSAHDACLGGVDPGRLRIEHGEVRRPKRKLIGHVDPLFFPSDATDFRRRANRDEARLQPSDSARRYDRSVISDSPDLVVPTLGNETRAWSYGAPDGPPLILVHGFRGDHHGLDGLARALTARLPELRAVVPDLPGFGATPAVPGRSHDLALYGAWLREFASGIAPDGRFAVLGHSFGSLVVASAIAGGLQPRRLALVNPISAPALKGPQAALTQLAVAYYRAAELLPERASRSLLGHPVIVRVMSEVMAKTGDRELRHWIHGQHAAYFSSFSDPSTLLEAFRASVSHTVLEFADHFTMPSLIIAGERDDITPLAQQLDLHHRVADSQLRIIPGTGHLIHYEAVSDAAAFLSDFLTAADIETAAA